jgi:HlyD family secretion protein
MKRALSAVVVLAAVGVGGVAYFRYRSQPDEPTVTTATVSRGDIVESVGATGTLEAVTTVQVGTQVSGTVMELHADFNSIVKRGQIVARLDPSLFETQIEQQRANLVRSQAEVERLKVALDDARTKLTRATELAARNLIPKSELETAQVAVRAAEAQLRSSEAQLTQARASLNQAEVNLQHTVIAAPIDGIVISRNVDVGQTVAASMQAPTLFVIAADLTKMRVNASIDEADVGRMRPGQTVQFRVDAYPGEEFHGVVSQVRLQPVVVQNVVTYATVIDVPNATLKLKPGMTANVTIEIARREGVVRVPATALRFRPTAETFAALKQEPPAEAQRPSPPQPSRDSAPSSGRGTGDSERNERIMERLRALPPEQRDRMMQRRREPDGAPEARGGTPTTPRPGEPPRTVDALFGPLPQTETTGRVWRFVDGRIEPVRVRLGITDGTYVALVGGDLEPGVELVTAVVLAQDGAGSPGGRSPLLPGRRGR